MKQRVVIAMAHSYPGWTAAVYYFRSPQSLLCYLPYCHLSPSVWDQERPDTIVSIPFMLLALTIVSALGPGLVNLVLALILSNIPMYTRVIRSASF